MNSRARLFDPLGIGPTEWFTDRNGEPVAASGLRMTPRGLARIGVIMLNRGMWDDRCVVPAQMDRALVNTAGRYRRNPAIRLPLVFGQIRIHCCVGTALGPFELERFWSAIGNGGQRLFVFPGLDLVVAITAGNYDTQDQCVPPTRVMREVILPAIA